MKRFIQYFKDRVPISAGVLLYAVTDGATSVLLAFPGGPWKNKRWGIPKGHVEEGETIEQCALREFTEETRISPTGELEYLGYQRRKGPHPKEMYIYACRGTGDESFGGSNTGVTYVNGKRVTYPEISECRWFPIDEAESVVSSFQRGFISSLRMML